MSFKAAVFDSLHQLFQFLALRLREQGDGRAFNGGIAGLNNF